MKVTARDLVILGVFSALLCFGCVIVLRRSSAGDQPPIEARVPDAKSSRGSHASAEPATTPSRAASGAFVSALPLGTIPPEYKLIVDRKLFSPLVAPPAAKGSGSTRPAAVNLGPIPSIIPPVTVVGPTRPVTPPPPKPPQPPAVVPPPAPKPPLACTGLMRLGGNKAVIENTRYGTARILGVGESAWGWQVTYIDTKRAVVGLSSTDPVLGKTLVLKLGDKRRVEPLRSGYSDAAPPRPDMSPGDEGDEVG